MGSVAIDLEDSEAKTTMPTTSSEIRSFAVFWLSSSLYQCCEAWTHVEETHRNTSNPAHPLLKPCAMQA